MKLHRVCSSLKESVHLPVSNLIMHFLLSFVSSFTHLFLHSFTHLFCHSFTWLCASELNHTNLFCFSLDLKQLQKMSLLNNSVYDKQALEVNKQCNSITQSVSQPTNQSINHSINHLISHSIDHPINQSVNQSIN